MSIRSTKQKTIFFFIFKLLPAVSVVFFVFCFSFSCANLASATSFKSGLSVEELGKFAKNDIFFYDPSDCRNNASGELCGDNARARYWTALSEYYDDPIQIAGIIGNLHSEGDLNPVSWQCGNGISNSGNFANGDWDYYYNLDADVGVGSFGITSGLNTYLHYVNDNAPELIKYFSNPSEYSFNYCYHESDWDYDEVTHTYGDELLEKIGSADFDNLVKTEVKYAMEEFKTGVSDNYKDTKWSSPTDASNYWAEFWEVCGGSNGHECLDSYESSPTKQERARYAEKTYDDLKGTSCSDTGSGSCSELKELRTAMWTKTSQKDREDFMYTVSQENHSIAGVEGYMNQVLAYNDGDLSSWLDGQCKAFRGGASCRGSHTITDDEQDWINEALGGSNHIKFAIGNATGGSNVGAGKIVCVWDGEKCRDDVDYSAEGGKGACSVYSPSADFGECWGLEGAEDWVDEVSAKCESVEPSGSTKSSGSSGITWIGDSYSVQANNKGLLSKEFSGVDIGSGSSDTYSSYIQGSKFVSSGGGSNPPCLDILQNVIDSNKLRPYLVFACGTNGGWSDDDVSEFQDLLSGTNTKAVVVTSKIPGNDYSESNKRLREMANSNDNISLADWTTVYDESYFAGDPEKIHPVTDPGYEKWVGVIKDALEEGYDSGVEWEDGWIVEESMNGAEIENMNERASELNESPNGVGTYNTSDGKPNKILLHSTEEIGRDGIDIYPSGNVYPAHFVINLKDKKVWQHFSIYQPSLAIASHDKDGPIQIEIVGFSTPSSKGYESEWDVNNFSDEDWDYLAKLLWAISEETGIPLTSSMSWGDDAKKLSAEEFLDYEGILGHMHVPDNDHTDPGDIWAYVEAAIKRLNNDCTTATFEGEYPEYRQYDERWGNLPYGHDLGNGTYDGYFHDSACGPTAMAVIVTLTSGQDVLPTDVADLLEEEYDGDPLYWVSPMSTLDPIVCEKYGCEVEVIEKTEEEVRQYLKNGWYIHTSGSCGGGHSSTCPYSAEGHYVALLGIDNNDIVTIEDPGWGDSAIQEYKLSDIVNNMGAAVAIRGNGRNSSGEQCNTDICKDNNSSSAGKGVESDKPIGPIHDPSEDIPCDPRTKDLGVRDDAYYDYEQYSIRLCSIPNIKMTGTQGDDGDDGYVHVNSRVSGAFYALSEEHKKKCGNYLEAYDDYRTNEEQTYYYNCYITGSCNGGTLAAVPGSKWSNHQGGLAIDFDTSTYCSSDSSVASGPGGLLNSDFLAQFGLEDGRNFSQFENWHVQAAEQ